MINFQTNKFKNFKLNDYPKLLLKIVLIIVAGSISSLFFIKTDESIRRRRFESFYIDKKLTIKDIESLYAKRECDESPIVISSEKYANQIIEMDNL